MDQSGEEPLSKSSWNFVESRVTTEADTLYLVEMKHFQAFEGRNFEGSFIFLNGGISEPPDSFRNDYLIIQDDPYDLSNPDAKVVSVRVSGSNPQSGKMGRRAFNDLFRRRDCDNCRAETTRR